MGRLIGAPQPPGTARLSFPVRRASIERAHNVRPYTRFTEAFRLTGDGVLEVRWVLGGEPVRTPAPTGGLLEHPGGRRTARRVAAPYGDLRNNNNYRQVRRHLPHNEQRNHLQVSEASRSEAGRAAAAVYSRTKDGGTLSGYLLLCESHRRRVRSCAVNPRTSLPRRRRSLGFLGGSESGLCPPAGG
jgi:hypothetical protein